MTIIEIVIDTVTKTHLYSKAMKKLVYRVNVVRPPKKRPNEYVWLNGGQVGKDYSN